jgi:hypothetical protein
MLLGNFRGREGGSVGRYKAPISTAKVEAILAKTAHSDRKRFDAVLELLQQPTLGLRLTPLVFAKLIELTQSKRPDVARRACKAIIAYANTAVPHLPIPALAEFSAVPAFPEIDASPVHSQLPGAGAEVSTKTQYSKIATSLPASLCNPEFQIPQTRLTSPSPSITMTHPAVDQRVINKHEPPNCQARRKETDWNSAK